jgi:hypothetical protein
MPIFILIFILIFVLTSIPMMTGWVVVIIVMPVMTSMPVPTPVSPMAPETARSSAEECSVLPVRRQQRT